MLNGSWWQKCKSKFVLKSIDQSLHQKTVFVSLYFSSDLTALILHPSNPYSISCHLGNLYVKKKKRKVRRPELPRHVLPR